MKTKRNRIVQLETYLDECVAYAESFGKKTKTRAKWMAEADAAREELRQLDH